SLKNTRSSASQSSLKSQSSAPSANNTLDRSYRRFAHSTNPDFSFESFLAKKRQALLYREQLDRQVEEKQQKNLRTTIMKRIKDAMLDRKVTEQQKHLKEEFERDHRFVRGVETVGVDRAILDGSNTVGHHEAFPLISNVSV